MPGGAECRLIITNPPFFENHSKTIDALRNTARHTDQLPFTDLIGIAGRLLSRQGLLYLLLPAHAVEKFSALTFSRTTAAFTERLLTIYESHGIYSRDSEAYLTDFLLRFAKK